MVKLYAVIRKDKEKENSRWIKDQFSFPNWRFKSERFAFRKEGVKLIKI